MWSLPGPSALPLLRRDAHLLGRPDFEGPYQGGTGRSLPKGILIACSLSALFASSAATLLVWKQLKNYRKPNLQRYVVRLLIMVPIYSIASCISLFSLDAAFVVDLVRDLYEAFVIYCFFNLLIEWLGGERSTIVLLHGREPTPHLFPLNYFFQPLDASDPFTFLALKRGVLQYVQIKPILAVITVVCKSLGIYEDGKLRLNNGYTWVSLTYNLSVFWSLYCLGIFWVCLSEDLKPFRVTWKFICIKGIIFFSFWQSLGISILVAAGLIRQIGPVADAEYISLAVQDMLICFEMPLFAIMHAYAFSHKDYIDPFSFHAARLPVLYAARDAIGGYDVWTDSLTTLRGTGYGYQTFEPSEGVVHAELGRKRRYAAGLRYADGGRTKYWLPQRTTGDPTDIPGDRHRSPMTRFRRYLNRKRMEMAGYAPLLPEEAAEAVHPAAEDEEGAEGEQTQEQAEHRKNVLLAKARGGVQSTVRYVDTVLIPEPDEDSPASLEFDSPDEDQDGLYAKSRQLGGGGASAPGGDWGFPTVDPQAERRRAEERLDQKREKARKADVRKRQQAQKKERDQAQAEKGRDRKWSQSQFASYADDEREPGSSTAKTHSEAGESSADAEQPSPDGEAEAEAGGSEEANAAPAGAVDLIVEDREAEQRERTRERRRGDPALRAGDQKRIFRREWREVAAGQAARERQQKQRKADRREGEGEEAPVDLVYRPNIVKELEAAAKKASEGDGEAVEAGAGVYEEENVWQDQQDVDKADKARRGSQQHHHADTVREREGGDEGQYASDIIVVSGASQPIAKQRDLGDAIPSPKQEPAK